MNVIITQIGHPNFRGGGNAVAHNLAEAFARQGNAVTAVFLAPRHLMREKPETAYELILLPASRVPIVNCLRVARYVRRRISDTPVILSIGYEGYLIPRLKGEAIFVSAAHNFLRTVALKHLFHPRWLNPLNGGKFLYEWSVYLDKKTKQRADFVQALCEFGKKQCVEIYGIPVENIFIVPNGINIGKMDFFKEVQLPKNKTILFLGGSSRHKGLDILLYALPAVFEKHPDARVVVLGEMKREEVSLRALAKKLGVYEHIVWRGLVSLDEMPKFYREAYAAVFPSRVESFLLGALEAMACGVPIVVTQVGVMPEIIEDGVNGCIINSEDAPGLAEKIIFLLDDPERARRIGLAGRKTIEEKGLSWDSVAEQFEKIIESKTGVSA